MSRLLEYLPAMYREEAFAGDFLKAFEKILLARPDGGDVPRQGIEDTVAGLARYFEPLTAPEDFLPWLAQWTAFSLRADLTIEKQRNFLSRIIALYQWRGTKKNLQELLSIFTIGIPTVSEAGATELQIGVHSTIGEDMYLGGGSTHYFHVTVALPRTSAEALARQGEIARALIELEKPAHTFYTLEALFPSLKIGEHSTIGVDTLLGAAVE
jgi:phage tail-like protein